MYSDELFAILSRLLSPTKVNFLGVYPRDKIPHIDKTSSFPLCFIVNTDPSKKPGQHWVAFYYTSPSSPEYFDSYGLPPDFYHIPISPKHMNHKTIQSLDSDVCGQYCIYYLYQRSHGKSLVQSVNSFSSDDLVWNDNSVARFVSNILAKQQYGPKRQVGGSYSQRCVKRNSFYVIHLDDE